MSQLPLDQDQLVKQLNEIEQIERKGKLPERDNINLAILIFTGVLGSIVYALAILRGGFQGIHSNVVLALLVTTLIAAFGAYKNNFAGKLFLSLIPLGVNLYMTFLSNEHYSELLYLLDSSLVFVIANQFYKKGYITALILVLTKVTGVYFYFPSSRGIEDLFSILIIISAVGAAPVLITSLAIASRKAKKQEIRSEILSLQNQDLLQSWGEFYKSKEPKNPLPQIQPTSPQTNEAPVYVSPYSQN